MSFKEELKRVLPAGIPHRDCLVEKAAHHLKLIETANEHMNLTRLTSPREAAIKHVFDSVAPWHLFNGCRRVLDAGTGAGFPGIPLSVVLPDLKFTLSESIQKKARFVDAAVESLELSNVHVTSDRAEQIASARKPELIIARAVAPMSKLLDLFGPAVKRGACLLLYKGPDVDQDLEDAHKHRFHAELVFRYDLPDDLGSRSVLRIRNTSGS